MLSFEETEDQQILRENISSLVSGFSDEYWRRHDSEAEFPQEFFDALANAGWFNLIVPSEYGGAGLGLQELSIAIHEIARLAGMAPANIMMLSCVFGVYAIKSFAKESVKKRLLTEFAQHAHVVSFCHTEPSAGVNTFDISTTATKDKDGYIINGQKIWSTLAHKATIINIVARTIPKDKVSKKSEGLTIFLLDTRELKRGNVRCKRIDDISMRALGSNEVFFEDVFIPEENILGEVNKAWQVLPPLLNAERISTASMSIGIGDLVLRKATQYAKSRHVFSRPIGSNQAIQFPLARAKADLESAWAITKIASWQFDNSQDCSVAANVAAYMGAKAGFSAADRAMQTFGGMGFSKVSDIERHWRDSRTFRAGPVPEEMVLSMIGQHVLRLPRSF